MIGDSGTRLVNSASIIFRRLALVSFVGTLIATYLVHHSYVNANLSTANNLQTILVLLGGFFVTILFCAASYALGNL
jgi:ABC-type multidrug transport system permease subunit